MLATWLLCSPRPRQPLSPPPPPGVCLDVLLDVTAAAGPPVSWTVSLADYSPGAQERDLSLIPAGQEFHLEIEAMDALNNKWVFGCVQAYWAV